MENKALEYCIEIYEQYTREEVNNFHGSIIRCWKVGKRAKKDPVVGCEVKNMCGNFMEGKCGDWCEKYPQITENKKE